MRTFLYGLQLKNYRGIGSATQKIAPFKSCNFFIGSNNAGKSCVLHFLAKHLESLGKIGTRADGLKLEPLEVHLGAVADQVQIGIGYPIDVLQASTTELFQQRGRENDVQAIRLLRELLEYLAEDEIVWVESGALNLRDGRFSKSASGNLRARLPDNHWQYLWNILTGQQGGGIQNWISETLNVIMPKERLPLPRSIIVPAIRQIGLKGSQFGDFSGQGLIDRLAELQNPGATERHFFEKFSRINNFLREVTDNPTALIEIPHNRDYVLVHIDNRVLPLASLGTGIHEVVMIAAFCTLTEESVVCIEEPEIHLHPLLQRKLIGYLTKKTGNQYFIATHSASFIDTPDAAVFHVSQDDGQTKIFEAISPKQRFEICRDLGYRASDLVQTNAVIWVEGPSDRIYLRNWIHGVDESLVEGIHYSIMFYGGRLLSHLSANDDEVTDFISLRRLNRHIAILIDSDKSSSRSPINETKRRVLAEFDANGGVGWLTAGREIENYIEPTVLETALREVYRSSFMQVVSTDRYEHRLHFEAAKQVVRTEVDKVKVARAVCSQRLNLKVLDLEKQIRRVVKMVQDANT